MLARPGTLTSPWQDWTEGAGPLRLNGAVDIANHRQAWALLPRVGELANANLSGVITGRVSVLAGPAVTCGPARGGDRREALDEHERSRFQLLQNVGRTQAHLPYCAFDLIYLDGTDLRGKTLLERKELLKRILLRSHFSATERNGNVAE